MCQQSLYILALASGIFSGGNLGAKSGKMIPVMIGSILLGGSRYTLREYLQVLSIILGTMMVSMGKKKGAGSSSTAGLVYMPLSHLTALGGLQNRLKRVKLAAFDRSHMTSCSGPSLFMAAIALMVSLVNGQLFSEASAI